MGNKVKYGAFHDLHSVPLEEGKLKPFHETLTLRKAKLDVNRRDGIALYTSTCASYLGTKVNHGELVKLFHCYTGEIDLHWLTNFP